MRVEKLDVFGRTAASEVGRLTSMEIRFPSSTMSSTVLHEMAHLAYIDIGSGALGPNSALFEQLDFLLKRRAPINHRGDSLRTRDAWLWRPCHDAS